MIEQISQIAKLQQLAEGGVPKQFNATLPVSIQVLRKLDPLHYLLKVGNTQLETKSTQELTLGGRYWAQMGKSSVGSILISQLALQPKLAESGKPPPTLDGKSILELFSAPDGSERIKQALLEQAVHAQSRQEFLFLANTLLGMQAGVLTLPFWDDQGRHAATLQMRKKRLQGAEENSLEFYALFSNLGPMSGVLVYEQGEVGLLLKVQYESTLAFLERQCDQLRGIDHVRLQKDSPLLPLYDFSENLLDLKG